MNVIKCDTCGITSDAPMPHERLHERRDWRELVVRKAPDWTPKTESCGGHAFRYVDAWPGYDQWWCSDTVTLHSCSESCMFEALAKLHDGSAVVSFSGFSIKTDALIRAMVEDAAAMLREP